MPSPPDPIDPIENLRAEVASLRDALRTQQREIVALRDGSADQAMPASLVLGSHASTPPEPPTRDLVAGGIDRRGLLRRAGAVAVGTVAGGAALAVAQAEPAAAQNGDGMKVGLLNLAANETELGLGTGGNIGSGTTRSGLVVTDGDSTTDGLTYAFSAIATGSAVDHGVYAHSLRGTGVRAHAPIGMSTNSAVADLWFASAAAVPSTRGFSGTAGMLSRDVNGDLWLCVASALVLGDPGQWRKVGGPATAGALHLLPSTTRVYDSRVGPGRFTNHQERVIDCTRNSSGVPHKCTAVMVNLTATNTNPGGFFAAFANGVTWSGSSSLNWALPNSTVANLAVVAVDPLTQFVARCEGAGGADLVVDVIAYYQ